MSKSAEKKFTLFSSSKQQEKGALLQNSPNFPRKRKRKGQKAPPQVSPSFLRSDMGFFLFRALKPCAGESVGRLHCAGGGLYHMAWRHLSMHGAVSHKGDIGSQRGGGAPFVSHSPPADKMD